MWGDKTSNIRYLIENYYDIQKLRIETYNRIVAYVKENPDKFKIDKETTSLINNKRYSDFARKYLTTNKVESKELENLIWFHNQLYKTEKTLYRKIDTWSYNHPLRTEYLNYVIGIGPILASGIIAWLCDPILKAEKVSQLWSYCGLAPKQERRKGEKVNYNPKLKTFCWKIGQSFIRFKCFGRRLYDASRQYIENREPNWSPLHHHNWANRRTVKLFLASVWEKWRQMNNLPVTEPYPVKFLDHSTKIRPEDWIEAKHRTETQNLL